jgi:signal transduction histidine kinase
VSRIAHGKLELQRERLDLVPIVRTICHDQRAHFDEQLLVLAFEADDDPIWVEVDVTRLTQVLDNLLHNAHKFTPPMGRVQVTVKSAQGAAEIVVRDTGIGMESHDLKRVFEPLAQVPSARSRSHGGLGLGLAPGAASSSRWCCLWPHPRQPSPDPRSRRPRSGISRSS